MDVASSPSLTMCSSHRRSAMCRGCITDGSIRYREDIVDGLENAPEAFIGMLDGHNFGKLIVRVE